MIQTNRSVGDTVTLQALMKLVNGVDDRLRSIKEEWSARKRRPVPVGLYLWSNRGGLGKTDFIRRLALVLSKRVEGFNSRIYSIQPSATHLLAIMASILCTMTRSVQCIIVMRRLRCLLK